MKNNTRKILAFGVLGLFVFMFALNLVAAAWTISIGKDTDAGVHQKIDNPDWLLGTVEFFNLGETWADMIVAIAIIVMIFAAAFDILEFTAFESPWVKYTISIAIAAIFAVTGGVGMFVIWMARLVGGSVMIATFLAILVAILFFLGGTWAKGKMRKFTYKKQADEAEGAFALSRATTMGHVKEAKAAARAAHEKY